MPGLPSLAGTLVAGLASFLAPCTLPLVPAYLSYVGGVAAADLADPALRRRARPRMLVGAILYVLGFTTVLVIGGLGIAGLTHAGLGPPRWVSVGAGLVLVVLGLGLSGAVRGPLRLGDRHLPGADRLRRLGPAGAYPLGLIMGLGWTPCVGPFLLAALSLAATSGSALDGAVLLAVYSLGLGIPFIAAALVGASMPDLGAYLARWAGPMSRAGGVVVAVLGVLLLTGLYTGLSSWLAQLGTPA